MRSRLLAALLLAAPAVVGCSHHGSDAQAAEGFKLIHADDLQKLQTSGNVAVFDANTPDFRKDNGIVPGAKLLSGMEFDASKELPADKGTPLVFYCANSH